MNNCNKIEVYYGYLNYTSLFVLVFLTTLSVARSTQCRILGQWTVNLSGFERQQCGQKSSYCAFICVETERKGESCRVTRQARTDER